MSSEYGELSILNPLSCSHEIEHLHGDRRSEVNPSQGQPISRRELRGREKTRAVWKQFLVYPAMVGIALWTAVNAVWAMPMRAYSYYQNKEFYHQVEQAQIKALGESLNIDLSSGQLGNEQEGAGNQLTLTSLKEELIKDVQDNPSLSGKRKKIAKKAIEIRDKIVKLQKGEFVWCGIEGIKKDLAEVMAMREYQNLERSKDCQAINFLQVVAYMLTDVDCFKIYEDYGRKCLENRFAGRDDITPEEVHQAIDDFLKKSPINADHGRLKYAAIFPDRTAIVSITSNLDPEGFDGTQGNSNMRASERDAAVRDYDGPNPVGNAVYRHGYLPLCKKLGLNELRIDHLDTTKTSEDIWVQELEKIAVEYKDTLYYARLGFPPKIALKDAPITVDIEKCCRDWAKGIHVNILDDVLSREEQAKAIDQAIQFCKKSYPNPNDPELTPKQRIEMVREIQGITNAFLINAIRDQYRKITPESVQNRHEAFKNSMTKACKECVDRGPAQEAITQQIGAFVLGGNKKKTYLAKDAYAYAGRLLFRCQYVNGRSPIKRRCDVAGGVSNRIQKGISSGEAQFPGPAGSGL